MVSHQISKDTKGISPSDWEGRCGNQVREQVRVVCKACDGKRCVKMNVAAGDAEKIS